MRRFSHLMRDRVSKMGERKEERWQQLNNHRYRITKL